MKNKTFCFPLNSPIFVMLNLHNFLRHDRLHFGYNHKSEARHPIFFISSEQVVNEFDY